MNMAQTQNITQELRVIVFFFFFFQITMPLSHEMIYDLIIGKS